MSNWFRTYGLSDVYDGLIVGAMPLDASDVQMLRSIGVNRVLNLVEDVEYQAGSRPEVQRTLDESGILERRLSTEDYGGLSPELLDAAVAAVNVWLDEGQTVYLHCRAGWQRSPTVAAAVLAIRERIDPNTALRLIQARKPSAEPLPHQLADLASWWQTRSHSSSSPAL